LLGNPILPPLLKLANQLNVVRMQYYLALPRFLIKVTDNWVVRGRRKERLSNYCG
jgi:hypothetical protein